MVIIEANVRGAERIVTFQSKAAAFYFLKSISFWARIESITTTSVRTKVQVLSECGHLSSWEGAVKSARDYKENDKEFLFFFDCFKISQEMKEKHDLLYAPDSHGEKVETECKNRINTALASSGYKAIDIENFEGCLKRIFLVTVE